MSKEVFEKHANETAGEVTELLELSLLLARELAHKPNPTPLEKRFTTCVVKTSLSIMIGAMMIKGGQTDG